MNGPDSGESAHRMRRVSVKVLPDPAPAETNRGRSSVVTISRCWGIRVVRSMSYAFLRSNPRPWLNAHRVRGFSAAAISPASSASSRRPMVSSTRSSNCSNVIVPPCSASGKPERMPGTRPSPGSTSTSSSDAAPRNAGLAPLVVRYMPARVSSSSWSAAAPARR